MEVHESIWEVPLPSSPKVCSKAAELQSDPPSWELAQTLMQKASNAFCPAHVPHPTLATWTALYFAHSFPEPQEQHSSLEWKTHSRIFFSSWQSCLFPAVVKSDFSSDCPSAADIYLIWGRKRTSFSPPCSLMGKSWWVLLLLSHPEKDFKGGRTDSTRIKRLTVVLQTGLHTKVRGKQLPWSGNRL